MTILLLIRNIQKEENQMLSIPLVKKKKRLEQSVFKISTWWLRDTYYCNRLYFSSCNGRTVTVVR
jgi:hypothetical protein